MEDFKEGLLSDIFVFLMVMTHVPCQKKVLSCVLMDLKLHVYFKIVSKRRQKRLGALLTRPIFLFNADIALTREPAVRMHFLII